MKRDIRRFQFLVPNTRWYGKRCWLWFAPGVAALIPVLRRLGLSVDVIEANVDNLSEDSITQRIRDFQPDMVGISNMSIEYWRQAHACAGLVKAVAPSILTVMGGVHPSTLPAKVMRDTNVDFALLGEGEERLPLLLQSLSAGAADFPGLDGLGFRTAGGGVEIRPAERWIENLDALPLPEYDLFDWRKVMNFRQGAAGGIGTTRPPVGTVMTSRGCPYRCCFCAGWCTMGRKTRFRSAEHVLREIDMLVQTHGIRELIFQDDEMYGNRERAEAIIRGLRDRRYDLIWKNSNLASWRMDRELIQLMKDSGCYQITISPESGSERVLREIIHKPTRKQDALQVAQWCRELGVELQADFVIGFPGETWDEIRQTTNFAEELDADSVKFAVATPFPETELFQVAVARGYLPQDFEFYRDDALGFAHPVIETEEFTARELQMIRCLEWDRINFKTPEKARRYARVNQMSLDELQEFRRATRRKLGLHFFQQHGEDAGKAAASHD